MQLEVVLPEQRTNYDERCKKQTDNAYDYRYDSLTCNLRHFLRRETRNT